MAANAFMLHGTTAIPAVGKVPLAMGAATSFTEKDRQEACFSHSLKGIPNSCCHTTAPACVHTTMHSRSRVARASTRRRAKTAPLAPVIPTTIGSSNITAFVIGFTTHFTRTHQQCNYYGVSSESIGFTKGCLGVPLRSFDTL